MAHNHAAKFEIHMVHTRTESGIALTITFLTPMTHSAPIQRKVCVIVVHLQL
jgi:hypothetical protein